MFVRHGPSWFRIATVILVCWGLVVCFACVQQLRFGPEVLGHGFGQGLGPELGGPALLDAEAFAAAGVYDRALHAALPVWYDPSAALAVVAGLIGAVLLLLRRLTARPFLLVSLLALIVQFGWLLVGTDIVARKGAAMWPLPFLFVAVAVFALWLSGHARDERWVG